MSHGGMITQGGIILTTGETRSKGRLDAKFEHCREPYREAGRPQRTTGEL